MEEKMSKSDFYLYLALIMAVDNKESGICSSMGTKITTFSDFSWKDYVMTMGESCYLRLGAWATRKFLAECINTSNTVQDIINYMETME